jgi:hypothetical protein
LTPAVSQVYQDDTHRLIPYRYGDDSVLRRIADDEDEFDALKELEGATDDRLLGEGNKLPDISTHELLFGVTHAHIVNAAFTHPHPSGSRFNSPAWPARGAWYAAFELKTAEAEVGFYKSQELREIDWREPETFTMADYLADFRADFHDIRRKAAYKKCLDPDSYSASQSLAGDLLAAGSAGIVYPSVRRPRGTCLVCFRPALVTNVRQGRTVVLTFKSPASSPLIGYS